MDKSTLRVGKRKIPVSNLDKILYPGGQFTKASVIDYYSRVAPVLLPHFKKRPVTLVRYPDGVLKKSFYEKNAPGFTPEWVHTFPVPRTEGGVIQYVLIDDIATLVWAANLAALELHPFLHRAPNLDRPTHIVFDLDPGEGADILTCASVAFLVRELLARLKLKAFPKVSGSKGIQIYVPLNTPVSYDLTQAFARAVAELLTREHPRLIVANMSKALRTGKVFIDWSQNYPTKTTVGVYSLRAKHPQPFVSTPIRWAELKNALQIGSSKSLYFLPDAVLSRIREWGDLFAPVLNLRQRLPQNFIKMPPAGAAGRRPRSPGS
ncbi:MAG TPA: non-homologous end-joining DNA ligase [Verrucomicrobiae bacterium]|nr:non-homologous end-joining DNA ligase [Verrucomicrobiae bacterium]